MGDVILGIDFKARQALESAKLLALSQALAPDECFMDETDDFLGPDLPMLPPGFFIDKDSVGDEIFVDGNGISHFAEMSIQERVRRSIYHGLPYPKDSA